MPILSLVSCAWASLTGSTTGGPQDRNVELAKIGISTLAQEAQEQGDDWEDLLEQQALERAKKLELDIPQLEELEAKEDPLMGGKDDDPDEDGKGGEKKGKEQRRA